MTYAELGQKVKAKYPDYASVSDDELGRRVAAKYPEYQSRIKEKSVVDQAGDIARMLFPQSAKTIDQIKTYPDTLKALYGMAQNDPRKAGELAQAKQQEYLDQKNKTGLELAPYAIPFGGSIKAALGLGGVAGALTGASKDDASLQDIATSAGAGALTGGVLKGFGNTVGQTINKVGSEIVDQGEQLVLRALKPSKSQLTRFKKATGQDLADWLNKNNITGDFLAQADSRIDDLQAQFDDLALNSGAKVEKGKIQQLFIKRMEEMKSSVVPSVRAKAQELQEVLDNIIGKHGDTIDVQQLTQERRAIDALLKESQFGMPVEQASYLRSARDAIQEAVQNATQGMGKKDLKTLGKELRELIEFQKIAESQENLGRGTNILGLLPSIGAGVGGMVGGIPGIAGGFLASKAIQSPRVVSAGSRAMQASGSKIQALPQVGNRLEPLMRALRNVTAQQASQKRLP